MLGKPAHTRIKSDRNPASVCAPDAGFINLGFSLMA
jgi:hypothetical protein